MVWNFILVFVLGSLVTLATLAKIASGVLKVYIPDDPTEPPYLGIKLGRVSRTICSKKYVLFKVSVENIKTQK